MALERPLYAAKTFPSLFCVFILYMPLIIFLNKKKGETHPMPKQQEFNKFSYVLMTNFTILPSKLGLLYFL